jgi:hypothetical protein
MPLQPTIAPTSLMTPASDERGERPRLALATLRRPLAPVLGGLALTLAQVLFVGCLSFEESLTTTYLKLFRWDSVWYESIARTGYHSVVPPGPINMERDNVAFFPGVPVLAALVRDLSGLPSRVAVVLASQLACWGFWTYWLVYLRNLQASWPACVLAIALVAAHSCAFYLVVGYSESLFLLALLGYLYWSARRSAGTWWLAAGHGFLMTATRIIGLPVAFAPVLGVLGAWKPAAGRAAAPGRWTILVKRLLLAGVACLGGGGFFAYCAWQFGHWDLYMQTQRNGWGLVPDYLAFSRLDIYRLFAPQESPDIFVDPNDLSRLAVPLTTALFALLLAAEAWAGWRGVGGWWERAPWYFAAWCMFFVPVCGLVNVRMTSMIRYVLPVHVLLILAGVHLLARIEIQGFVREVGWAVALTIVANSACLQALLAYHFTLNHWIA